MNTVSPHIRTVLNRDGAAVLDTHRGEIATFNQTGATIWHGLVQGKPESQIAEDLAVATGADLVQVARDVHNFVEDLLAKGLIQ